MSTCPPFLFVKPRPILITQPSSIVFSHLLLVKPHPLLDADLFVLSELPPISLLYSLRYVVRYLVHLIKESVKGVGTNDDQLTDGVCLLFSFALCSLSLPLSLSLTLEEL